MEIYFCHLAGRQLEVGRYDHRFIKHKHLTANIDSLPLKEIDEFLGFPSEPQKRVLFYFHSWLGNFWPYHRHSLKKLVQIESIDKIVCLEWNPAALWYGYAWKKAFGQGQGLAQLVSRGLQQGNNAVLCHSMGNRLFEGVVSAFTAPVKVNLLILAAADLDLTAFDNGRQLDRLGQSQIVVLVNTHDRALRASKWVHRRPRLGRDGTDFTVFDGRPNVKIIDITAKLGGPIARTSHLYFKTNNAVFGIILDLLRS